MSFSARVLNPGTVRGQCLVLAEPLSFWGGYDPASGRIIDRGHPQAGASVSGAILVLPGSRGSAGTPAGIAESLRSGTGPAGFILRHDDVNLAIGAMVADALYATQTPVLVAQRDAYDSIESGVRLAIERDGQVRRIA